ncbi:MAG: YbaN family protein [Gammaproteobacteria bacterium]|nr:YbaN family protein [Gammaproteobacteria bacterium]MDH5653792.1 YbaN family protein [Gammaproteobacteria bacterium]
MKPLYLVLGWVFFGTGVVGAFLPVLPTTPFMILALWMFSKSSQRFHDWLYDHRIFGPSLQRWQTHRVIPPLAKLMSISMMSASFIYLVGWSSAPFWAVTCAGLLMAYGAWFILTKPSKTPVADRGEPA